MPQMPKTGTSLMGSSNDLALDARSLDNLKQQAAQNQPGAVKQAARQFEALFTQQLLSQMRKTSLAGDSSVAQALNGGSSASKTWHDMLDQQLAQKMAGVATPGSKEVVPEHSGLGLADMMEKQMTKQTVSAESLRRTGLPLNMSTLELARRATAASADASGSSSDAAAAQAAGLAPLGTVRRIQNGKFGAAATYAAMQGGTTVENYVRNARARGAIPDTPSTGNASSAEEVRAEFLGRFLPAARRAEAVSGIPAAFILGQAALESGWGKHEIRDAQGRTSHNLFGIKANGWNGSSVQTTTTEYQDGQSQQVSARFRAYGSYEEAFEDYARMLAANPRYSKVLQSTSSADQFAQGLQRAGYATDPNYAKKLSATIKHAMRVVV